MMSDSVRYELELLTSFDARSSSGSLLSADDGLRRLEQKIRSGAIGLATRIRFRVEPSQVVITDTFSGEEIEHIPIGLVDQPIVAIGNRNLAPYDSVLAFIVLEDQFHMAPPEMYCFQCIGGTAKQVAETLNTARSGRLQQRKSNSDYAPDYRSPADKNKMQDIDRQAQQRSAMAASMYQPGPATGDMFRQSHNNGNADSEKTGQHIKLLDHCLDDIEKFVHRLQQAAEAFTKLEERRRQREGGADVVGPGDGMLAMRSRPPPAQDFVDIFQKFKLSMNLLACLKGHIHDPNAPEMVHFLFKPLGLILDSVRDPINGTPVLAQKVIGPLLSNDAVQLLTDCLTTRESQLWMSLGDAWTMSRDQWPTSVPPYVPTFSDGWSPPAHLFDENEPSQSLHRYGPMPEEPLLPSVPIAESKLPEPDRKALATPLYPAAAEVTGFVDEQQQQQQQKFVWELTARKAKMCILTEPYVANTHKELSARKGEIVEVLSDDRNWWNVRNSSGQMGFLPYTLLRSYTPQDMPPQPSNDRQTAFTNGDVRPPMTVVRAAEPPPPVAMRSPVPPPQKSAPPPDRRSVPVPYSQEPSPPMPSPRQVPQNDVRRSYPSPDPPLASTSSLEHRKSFAGERPSAIAAPAFGAQVTPVPPPRHQLSREADYYDVADDVNAGNYRQRTAVDDLNDEFREKLSGGQAVKPRQKTPQSAYITQESTNEEVVLWLQYKGFSAKVQDALSTYDGKRLFGPSMSKANLERMFGVEEGGRLSSQILVQRNRSGYQTARSSELRAILKNRKQKTDEDESTNGDAF